MEAEGTESRALMVAASTLKMTAPPALGTLLQILFLPRTGTYTHAIRRAHMAWVIRLHIRLHSELTAPDTHVHRRSF